MEKNKKIRREKKKMTKQKIIGEDERIKELKKLKQKVDDSLENGRELKREVIKKVDSFLENAEELSDDINTRLQEHEYEKTTMDETKEVIIELIKVTEDKTGMNLTGLIKRLS